MELELQPLNLPSNNERLTVIAGPCSAETEEQVMSTAMQLAAKGCHIFRAGVWKPRTKPGGFEGNGEKALPWMQRVKETTGMLVATEVATAEHVELALKYGIDVLWIGARTSANPFAMQAIADSLQGMDIPVLVKNPVNPDIELWIGAMERLNQAGIKRIAAIHRGFSSYDKKIYRNLPMWQIPIELRRRIPELPIFCDPSHIGGRRELIAPLSQEAMDAFLARMNEFRRLCAAMDKSDAAILALSDEIASLQEKQNTCTEAIERQQKNQWELEKKLAKAFPGYENYFKANIGATLSIYTGSGVLGAAIQYLD